MKLKASLIAALFAAVPAAHALAAPRGAADCTGSACGEHAKERSGVKTSQNARENRPAPNRSSGEGASREQQNGKPAQKAAVPAKDIPIAPPGGQPRASLEFGHNSGAEAALTSGWGSSTGTPPFTIADRAQVSLVVGNVPPSANNVRVVLRGQPFLAPPRVAQQTVEVFLQGKRLGGETFKERRQEPAELVASLGSMKLQAKQQLILEIRVPTAQAVPGVDSRALGFQLSSIRIEYD